MLILAWQKSSENTESMAKVLMTVISSSSGFISFRILKSNRKYVPWNSVAFSYWEHHFVSYYTGSYLL